MTQLRRAPGLGGLRGHVRAEGGQVALRVVTAWAHVPPGQWEFGFPSGPRCRPVTVSPEPIARKTAGQLPVLPQDPARKQFRPVPRSEFKAGSGIVPLASCPTVVVKPSLGVGPLFSFPSGVGLSGTLIFHSQHPLHLVPMIPCSSIPASPVLHSQHPLLLVPRIPCSPSQDPLLSAPRSSSSFLSGLSAFAPP